MRIPVRERSLSGFSLLASLFLTLVIFGVPMRYSSAASVALTLGLLLLIGWATFRLVRSAWRSGEEVQRRVAINGVLLIVPWALLTLMPGYGPPFAATPPMNHARFVILFVAVAVLGAGFLLLGHSLVEQGDHLLAPLAQAAGLAGTFIQLVWAAILIGSTMLEAHKPAGYVPVYDALLDNASDVLLFFGGLLTYVATALFALSFARLNWIGQRKAISIAVISAFAVLVLIGRGLRYPDLSQHWYEVPAMIVGIPAIPWLMPYMLGICALLHAARKGGLREGIQGPRPLAGCGAAPHR